MHIPDSVLDAKVIAATVAVGALGLAVAVRRLERRLGERTTVLMGTMAAFVFAAQMVNFPVGPGVSGHLLGGVLAAVLLGPWAGAVVIAAVLLVQCFMFADGGVTALGANFVNMGLIGAVGGYAIYAPIRRAIGGSTGILIAAMAAAWFSVLLASGACAVELAASGHRDQFLTILAWMALRARGDRAGRSTHHRGGRPLSARAAARSVRRAGCRCRSGCSRFSLCQCQALGPGDRRAAWASHWRSRYSWRRSPMISRTAWSSSARSLSFCANRGTASRIPAPIPDYQLPIAGAAHVKMATAAAGLVGTLVVFGVAWGMARILPRAKQIEAHADAA